MRAGTNCGYDAGFESEGAWMLENVFESREFKLVQVCWLREYACKWKEEDVEVKQSHADRGVHIRKPNRRCLRVHILATPQPASTKNNKESYIRQLVSDKLPNASGSVNMAKDDKITAAYWQTTHQTFVKSTKLCGPYD